MSLTKLESAIEYFTYFDLKHYQKVLEVKYNTKIESKIPAKFERVFMPEKGLISYLKNKFKN